MTVTNVMVTKIEESEIDENTSMELRKDFMPFFDQANEWAKQAKLIVVKSADQVEDIKLARKLRLDFKNLRVSVEKKRLSRKAGLTREGKAIDGVSNIVKALIVPIEEHLQEQEDFVKIEEQRIKEELREKRVQELEKYNVDVTNFRDLSEMPKESFAQLVENSKNAFALKKEAERKLEQERIDREKAENEERERHRVENEKLKKEAAEREKAIEIERKKQEQILAEQKAIAEKEAAEREKAQAALRAKEEADEKAQIAAQRIKDAEIAAADKAEKEANLAPDKKKLESLAVMITRVGMPDVKAPKAKKILEQVVSGLNDISGMIKRETLKL